MQALPFAPLISDRFGRRVTLFSGAILMLTGVILQWAARSVPVFIGSRVISKCARPNLIYTCSHYIYSRSWNLLFPQCCTSSHYGTGVSNSGEPLVQLCFRACELTRYRQSEGK
jgi:MFS family permease